MQEERYTVSGATYIAKIEESDEGTTLSIRKKASFTPIYTIFAQSEVLSINGEDFDLQHILYYGHDGNSLTVIGSQNHVYEEFEGDMEKIQTLLDDEIQCYKIPCSDAVANIIADACNL